MQESACISHLFAVYLGVDWGWKMMGLASLLKI